MAKFWSDILVPLAIAGAVAAQTVGVDMHRASRLHAWFPQVARDTVTAEVQDSTRPLRPDTATRLKPDTAAQQLPDTAKAITDTAKAIADTTRSPLDSLADEEDFDFFGEAADTLPKVFARDTMKVPDSLRITDPFLYQWYVATKDGYTHKVNRALRSWAERAGLEDVTHIKFYSARKSWATYARNLAGVEKATIDEALAHKGDYALADIYIAKSWDHLNAANKKVLALLRWPSN